MKLLLVLTLSLFVLQCKQEEDADAKTISIFVNPEEAYLFDSDYKIPGSDNTISGAYFRVQTRIQNSSTKYLSIVAIEVTANADLTSGPKEFETVLTPDEDAAAILRLAPGQTLTTGGLYIGGMPKKNLRATDYVDVQYKFVGFFEGSGATATSPGLPEKPFERYEYGAAR